MEAGCRIQSGFSHILSLRSQVGKAVIDVRFMQRRWEMLKILTRGDG